MIRYALVCDRGHGFESWFASFDACESQIARGLVACPACGSTLVAKQLMAPSVVRAGAETAAPPAPADLPDPLLSAEEHDRRARLSALRSQLLAHSDYVGPRFAEEARQMHAGESDHRSIWGEASPDDARALIEDGIAVMPLPPAFEDCN